MIFFRSLHKWLGLLLAVQVLIWVLSGMLISFIDAREVHGSSTRIPVPQREGLGKSGALVDLAELPVDMSRAESVQVFLLLGQPLYRLRIDNELKLFDATTGSKFEVDGALAQKLAVLSYGGDGPLTGVAYLADGSPEMRSVSGALWRADFADALDTRVYISATDGAVLAHRNNRWAVVDVLLMLHFMDYPRRDSFNNPQIIVLAFGALWLAISGQLLVFNSFSRSKGR